MSKQIGPIQFKGKLGTIVGRSTRKGTMSLGMAPTKYTNPQTPKQIVARSRFLAVQTFVNRVPRAAFAGFARSAQSGKMSLANMAFKYNLDTQNGHTALGPTSPLWAEPIILPDGSANAVMDKTFLKFSKGNYAITASAIDDKTPQHVKFTINHDFETVSNNLLYHVIVYCPESGEFLHTETGERDIDITVPTLWNGLKVYVYAYAQYWNDTVDFNYNPTSATSASAAFLAENAKTESTQTLYVGEVNIG